MGQQHQADKRPLSPHLTIYKPQITSVLSITHRLTGIALFGAVILLAWWVVFRVYGCASCLNGVLSHPAVFVASVLLSMVFFYHLLNGVRHLCWDAGKGYDINVAAKSGWAVIVGTVILTVASWLTSFYI